MNCVEASLDLRLSNRFCRYHALCIKKKKAGVKYLVIGEFFVSWDALLSKPETQSPETAVESTQNLLDSYFLHGNYW